ncbi:unnamed protein product [Orchesella dallaii]|uniref:EGF-like domain-containing protein n=1 Tax=Orchesella dallaii TaxID=48710 RepID=A0ABP1RC07_9HEXA
MTLEKLVKFFFISLIIPIFFLEITKGQTEAANVYFIANSDCSSHYSCTGETRDISVICQNSKCICDPRLGIYDPLRYQCVGKSNHSCLAELCTRNAMCDPSTFTCNCLPGYEMTSDGRCVHKYNETCDENEDCKGNLGCYDGLCECKYPTHEYYHPENDTCYSIAHSWDKHMKQIILRKGHPTEIDDQAVKSKWTTYFDTLASLARIGALVGISVLLWKIGVLLKEIQTSYRIHGYFLRSDTNGTSRGTSIQLETSLIDDKV